MTTDTIDYLMTPDEWRTLSPESRHKINRYRESVIDQLTAARNVISQFVHASAPMTPEQRAAWTAWKEGSE